MSFHSVITGIDPINGLPMVDPIGENSPLFMDVAQIIFQNLKADLPAVALVCKKWKTMADDEGFRQMIHPAQAVGAQEWRDYINVDAGEELPLPRCAYGNLEKEGGLLTFIPEKVKAAKENGAIEEVFLNSLDAIGKLLKKHKSDLEINNRMHSSEVKKAILKKRRPVKSHWVWIKKEVIGRDKTYVEQTELAKSCGAKISGLIDTVISVFMEYFRSKDGRFVLDGATCVRVSERTPVWRIWIGFSHSSLEVGHIYDCRIQCAGVVLARRSFVKIPHSEI